VKLESKYKDIIKFCKRQYIVESLILTINPKTYNTLIESQLVLYNIWFKNIKLLLNTQDYYFVKKIF